MKTLILAMLISASVLVMGGPRPNVDLDNNVEPDPLDWHHHHVHIYHHYHDKNSVVSSILIINKKFTIIKFKSSQFGRDVLFPKTKYPKILFLIPGDY